MASLCLSACGLGGEAPRVSLAPPPPSFTPTDHPNLADRAPTTLEKIGEKNIVLAENQALALRADPPVPADCSIKDRFDSSSFWSFSSVDGKRKWSLNVGTDSTRIEGATLRYTFKFSKGSTAGKKEHCLYPSRVQGLAPSAYRELVKRKNDTVWQHLRALKADLMD